MLGNFVHCKRERQRIVYIYSIHKVGNLISPDEHMTFVKQNTSLVELKTGKKYDTLISDYFTIHTQ